MHPYHLSEPPTGPLHVQRHLPGGTAPTTTAPATPSPPALQQRDAADRAAAQAQRWAILELAAALGVDPDGVDAEIGAAGRARVWSRLVGDVRVLAGVLAVLAVDLQAPHGWAGPWAN